MMFLKVLISVAAHNTGDEALANWYYWKDRAVFTEDESTVTRLPRTHTSPQQYLQCHCDAQKGMKAGTY